MNYLLHIDTSAETGTVAIGCDGKLLARKINEESRSHASNINNMISDVLNETGLSFQQLSGVVVCAGPGSYTGLRIGMATAKGICYAADKPLLPDNKLTVLAHQSYTRHGKKYPGYISLLKAREKEYFVVIYNNDFVCTMQPQHIVESSLTEIIDKNQNCCFVTDADQNLFKKPDAVNLYIERDIKIDLASWISYSFNRFMSGEHAKLASAEPFYLKQVYTHK